MKYQDALRILLVVVITTVASLMTLIVYFQQFESYVLFADDDNESQHNDFRSSNSTDQTTIGTLFVDEPQVHIFRPSTQSANQARMRQALEVKENRSTGSCQIAELRWLQDVDCESPTRIKFTYSCPKELMVMIMNHSLIATRQVGSAASYEPEEGNNSLTRNDAGLALLPGSDPSCPRFLFAHHFTQGLGHRIANVAFVASLADEFGFRLGVTNISWSGWISTHHAEYSGVRAAFGVREALLTELELPSDALPLAAKHDVGSREGFLAQYPSSYRLGCRISVRASLGTNRACAGRGWCFGEWPGAFRRARRLLQQALTASAAAAGRPTPPSACAHADGPARFRAARARGELAVAWHLRCGDIVLATDPAFYLNVKSILAAAGAPLRHFLFWRSCREFRFLLGLLPGAAVVDGSDTGIEETAALLAGADILVHTGGPSSPTLLASPPAHAHPSARPLARPHAHQPAPRRAHRSACPPARSPAHSHALLPRAARSPPLIAGPPSLLARPCRRPALLAGRPSSPAHARSRPALGVESMPRRPLHLSPR
jgi:hypothetical protein